MHDHELQQHYITKIIRNPQIPFYFWLDFPLLVTGAFIRLLLSHFDTDDQLVRDESTSAIRAVLTGRAFPWV